jgi:hypothetical protein
MTTTSPRIEWTRKEEYQPAEPVLYTWLTWQDYLILREGSTATESRWFSSSVSALIAFIISLIAFLPGMSLDNRGQFLAFAVLSGGAVVTGILALFFGRQRSRKGHSKVLSDLVARLEDQFSSSGRTKPDPNLPGGKGWIVKQVYR